MAATQQQIQDAIDAKLAQLWSVIKNKEDTYFSAHGQYWQGLRTHTALPIDGASALPDIGNKTPTDQPDGYPVALRNTAIPMALQIDVYDGSSGKGYQATVYVTIAGQIFARVTQVGAETYRTHGWANVTPGAI